MVTCFKPLNLSTGCICERDVILRTENSHSSKQHLLTDFCSGETVCFR
jgi:hypothetical protein